MVHLKVSEGKGYCPDSGFLVDAEEENLVVKN